MLEVKSGWQMRKFCRKTCRVCDFYEKRLLDSYLDDLRKEVANLDKLKNNAKV